jgi:hypothetical protein
VLATFPRTIDIRETVMKDCMSIWQKATIRDAFPDDYKDKRLAEYAKNPIRIGKAQGRLQSLIIPKIEHLCKILILQNQAPLAQ